MEKESQKNLVFYLVILAILRLVAGAALAGNGRDFWECTKGQNFTTGDQTNKNVNLVLSSLANRTATSGGFNTSVYGKTPNSVYAMAQCRGDSTSSDCLSCLQIAIPSVSQLCFPFPGGKFWRDQCFLRWEKDTDFIGKYDTTEEPHYAYNPGKSPDPVEFRKLVRGLLTNLTKQAVTNIKKRYSSGTAQDSTLPKLFGLVQCWRDISIDDCQSCLSTSLEMIFNNSAYLGGTILTPNCVARYETYSFFTPGPSPPPPRTASQPQPPQSPSQSTPSKDGSKNNRLPLILGSVAGFILVLIIALVFGYYYALKRKARPSKVRQGKNDKEGVNVGEENLENDDGLIIFTKGALMAATSDFGEDHKIGQGGFGVVYKGIL